tara:strand:+ start:3057 stop:4829 length:1773 start_codon:yes stop_codon:yes gene_type:complete
MTLPKDLLLPFQPGETPWSYCSRQGRRLGISAALFARHCGTILDALSDGVEDALDKLASVARIDPVELFRSAPKRLGKNRTLLYGEVVEETLDSRRKTIRYCPSCVLEQDGAQGRSILSQWLVLPVSICRRHNVELRTIDAKGYALDPAEHLAAISKFEACRDASPRYPRALERHWFTRMDGPPDSWLFRMPFDALVQLSLAIGLDRAEPPLTSGRDLSYNDWHETVCTGFEVLEGEEESIVEYLQLRDDLVRIDGRYRSPSSAYGTMYRFLRDHREDANFEAIRAILARHITENYPGQATLFGERVVPREYSSIKALGESKRIDPQRIRLMLRHQPSLTERPKGLRGRAVISPSSAKIIVASITNGSTEAQLRKILGARVLQVRALLELGAIPLVGRRGEKRLYSKSHAIDILTKVIGRSSVDPSEITSLEENQSNSIQAIATDRKILELILAGKVRTGFRSGQKEGLSGLLVSRADLIASVDEEDRGLTGVQIATRLRVSNAVLSDLHQLGALPRPSIRTARGFKLTPVSTVRAFEAQYATLGEIANGLGLSTNGAMKVLKAKKISALPLPCGRYSVFERADVENIIR